MDLDDIVAINVATMFVLYAASKAGSAIHLYEMALRVNGAHPNGQSRQTALMWQQQPD